MSTTTTAKKQTSPAAAVKKAVKTPAKVPAKAPAKAPVKTQPQVKAASPAQAPSKSGTANAPKVDKKKDKPEKVKVVRDSFTIPKTEYAQLAAMKKRAMNLGLEVKKSELIRAGLTLLVSTNDAAFRKALGNVPTLKTGRPGKD